MVSLLDGCVKSFQNIWERLHPVCEFGSNLHKKDKWSGERREREKKRLPDDDNRKMNKLLSVADGARGSARLTLRLLSPPHPSISSSIYHNSISASLYITASFYQRSDNIQAPIHPSLLIYLCRCSFSTNLLIHLSAFRRSSIRRLHTVPSA